MNTHSLIRRTLVASGLALAVLALAATGASAQRPAPAPMLEPLRVYASGQQATVEVYANEDVAISHTLREGGVAMLTGAARGTAEPGTGIELERPGGAADPAYQPRHNLKLAGLKSATTYVLTVRATNRAGRATTAETTFTTLKRRVRVTLDSITITGDGDFIGKGEPTWFWTVGYPVISVQDCFPASAGKCKEGSYGEGTFTPFNGAGTKYSYVFAEENFRSLGGEDYTVMPSQFVLRAKAVESDAGLGWLDDLFDWGAFLSGGNEASWQAPQGVETASQALTLTANDSSFRSTMTFHFDLFHDSGSYPPNDGRVHSTSK